MRKILVSSILLLFTCAIARGAIARDSIADAGVVNPAGPPSFGWNHTNNGNILYAGCWVNSGDIVTGITYNGVAMTLAGKVNVTGSEWAYLYRIVSPAIGTHTVLVSYGSYTALICKSISYTGASSSQPDADATNTASSVTSGTSFVTTLTTVANNSWVVGVVRINVLAVITADAGTSMAVGDTNEFDIIDTNGPVSPAGSHSLSVHANATGNWGSVIESFAPAGAVASGTIRHRVTSQ